MTVTLTLSPAVHRARHGQPLTTVRHDRGAASEMTLERDDLAAGGGLVDDPIRAVHALPRVSVADDFRSELTVRGSPFRQVGFVVDGVATPWLQHTAIGRGATGSLTMLSSQVLDQATLRVGAYPHRFGDRLGAELEMTVREGSRQQLECAVPLEEPTRPSSAKAHSDVRENARAGRGWFRRDRAIWSGRRRGRSPPERRLVSPTVWRKWFSTCVPTRKSGSPCWRGCRTSTARRALIRSCSAMGRIVQRWPICSGVRRWDHRSC